MRAVACVYLPRFPVQVELERRPLLRGTPLALVDGSAPTAGSRKVLWVSAEAEERGVRAGMAYRQAVALCRGLAALESDWSAYREAWERVLASLEALSPVVESAEPGVAFLDMSGTPAWRQGPQACLQAVAAAVPAPWVAQVGMANAKFTAYVAARRAQPGSPRWVGAREAAAFLAFQPLEWVPVPPEVHRRWKLLGLKTMGQLARLPKPAVCAQFGWAGGRAWSLCRGEDDEPLRPYQRPEILTERVQFSQPATTREAVVAACEQLVAALWQRRERQGRAVRKVRLQAVLEDGRVWEQTLVLKQATRDARRLAFCLRSLLQREHPAGAVEEMVLEALEFSPAAGVQGSLFRTGEEEARRRLAETVRELKARYGYNPVGRLVEVEPWSRLPERRAMLVEYEP